jgi:hypothetical protein
MYTTYTKLGLSVDNIILIIVTIHFCVMTELKLFLSVQTSDDFLRHRACDKGFLLLLYYISSNGNIGLVWCLIG